MERAFPGCGLRKRRARTNRRSLANAGGLWRKMVSRRRAAPRLQIRRGIARLRYQAGCRHTAGVELAHSVRCFEAWSTGDMLHVACGRTGMRELTPGDASREI